jgi:hypothetical protein
MKSLGSGRIPALAVVALVSLAAGCRGPLGEHEVAGGPRAGGLGSWGPVLELPTHPEQMAVLPSGKVLMWPWAPERKSPPHGPVALWDPSDGSFESYPGSGVESASGLAFQPDGTLVIAGGDAPEGGVDGNRRVFTFDYATSSLSRVRPMAAGRVFPGATTLGSGSIIVTGGLTEDESINRTPELWDGSTWTQLLDASNGESRGPTFQFLAPDGRLFRAGPEPLTDWLDVPTGTWSDVEADDRNQARYHGTAVMYDAGKILLAGGCPVGPENGWYGQCAETVFRSAEVIDLAEPFPVWRAVAPMAVARHSHHATLLPDGRVLITGGTDRPGIFNEEAAGILMAELWDPATESFTSVAAMDEPRHFQSTAVLLPDARVLVAGGAFGTNDVDARFSWSAQIYSPPYLDGGPRPVISEAPSSVRLGSAFRVETSDSTISSVVLVRLSASTGGWNHTQSITHLTFGARPDGLNVEAPRDSNLVPPGFYLLFVLNARGVPSVGHTLRVEPE